MLLAPIDTFLALVSLLVLLGSMLGSGFMYLARDETDHVPRGASKYGDDWRGPRQNTTLYKTNPPAQASGAGRLLGVAWITAVGFVAGFVAIFSMQSPWPIQTDLRHLAASLHCSAADLLDLRQAQIGQPGYHPRLDPDGNGIACDIAPVEIAQIPAELTRSLSNASLVWPTQSKQ